MGPSIHSVLAAVFGVVAQRRSYAQAFYSLIAFPLGTLYFVFLAVGLALGLGLVLLWVGFLILAFVLVASWGLAVFERQQAIVLLDAEVPPMRPAGPPSEDFGERVKGYLTNPVTWKGPIFLLLKFPLGILSFVVMVTSFCLGASLLLAPLYYTWSPPDFYFWVADTLPEALLCTLLGAAVLLLGLHLANGLGWVWRQLAQLLLGASAPGAEQPTPAA
ncbi:MAG: sensor domain-containing protein [Acidobacteriota bacterium]|nr:sensor domain-containing protein [Acidobacteriota bacterium]MDH3523361.1 sensor domain-containing protein [Acidobacteriota bacterium]